MAEEITSNKILQISKWSDEDKPREKLLNKGKYSLSDAELIGILIGSGTASINAIELAKYILNHVDNDLNELAKLSPQDLQKFKGIGEAKSITIVSALELGRRRKNSPEKKKDKIRTSRDVYELMTSELLDQDHEQFWVLLLNRNHQVIKKHQISTGGVSGTTVDPKMIFKVAIDRLASAIILIHNHPSGNLTPSKSDIELTQKLKNSGNVLDIPILDHVIFTDTDYFSMNDEGLL